MSQGTASSGPLGSRVLELVAVMDRLRSPGGCPWDAEQTHESLVEYLVEEAYETIEAIDEHDQVGLREELGDLLLQVVFHARIAQEHPDQPWTIDDVADGITVKLIERHPHVFGNADPGLTATDVEAQWQERKARAKGRRSVTDGVPMAMPSLVLARKLIGRARRGGVEVVAGSPRAQADARLAMTGLGDSRIDSPDATHSDPDAGTDPESGQAAATNDVFGDYLLALVAAAADDGIDADHALRAAIGRFRKQVVDQEGRTGDE
ncbi:MAG: MazG family protein [Candidatus Nanopelagicales bacterium]